MIENDLNKVLNYMKQYVENKYEHDSEPMLNWKDLRLVLDEIKRLQLENQKHKNWVNVLNKENHKLKETIQEMQEDIDILTSDDDNDSVWLEELNK